MNRYLAREIFHVALLGDSVFDNASYTNGQPDVISQVLLRADVLERSVKSSGEAFGLLAEVTSQFEGQYRRAVSACLGQNLPLVVCTIYHGNFEDEVFRRRAVVALTLFNDAIMRTAAENRLMVVDLRVICNEPADYANPVEPSSIGGAKIARAIVNAVTDSGPSGRGLRIVTV